jgi:hypothetical protein
LSIGRERTQEKDRAALQILQSTPPRLNDLKIFHQGIGNVSFVFDEAQSPVTAVTEPSPHMGDTSFVNMVRRACKKAFFEPGDTRQAVERGSRG